MTIETTHASTDRPQPRTGPFETQAPELRTAGSTGRSLGDRARTAGPLERGLGWFSIGLGATQLLAPRTVARLAGLRRNHDALIRFCGARELSCGIGILTQSRPSPWIEARVVGDVADLAMLGLALLSPRNSRGLTAAAFAAVAGVTALDVICSRELDRGRGAPGALLYGVPVECVVTINRSPQECYAFWRNLDNLPRFMEHLQEVTVFDERRSHWIARAPAGTHVEWDAEITEDRPNQMLAWRSLEGSDVPNTGTVRFEPAPAGRGTILRVTMQYDPPAGRLGAAVAKLFGEEPRQQVAGDLRRFKQLLETGEIATTMGQSAGKRSALGSLFRKGDRT